MDSFHLDLESRSDMSKTLEEIAEIIELHLRYNQVEDFMTKIYDQLEWAATEDPSIVADALIRVAGIFSTMAAEEVTLGIS